MDASQDPDIPDTPNAPESLTAPDTAARARAPRAPRRWRRDAIVAGVTGLTVLGAAAVGAAVVRGPDGIAMRAAGEHVGPDGGVALRAERGPQARVLRVRLAAGEGHGPQRALGAGGADRTDRAERIAALAEELGIDVDALTTAVQALHEELDAGRAARREELADLDPEARRTAMQAFAEERQARMRALLIDLGADPAAVDAHLAEHAERAERGPRAGHRGGR